MKPGNTFRGESIKLDIMKKSNIIIVAIVIAGLLAQSCTKEPIEGLGKIDTVILQVDQFTGIAQEGVSDVYISYGETQEVKVTGHPNIISQVETEVINGVWFMELQEGSYSDYELTFYLTIPAIDEVSSSGSGNIHITQFNNQPELEINLYGSGSFMGYPMQVADCRIRIEGSGECEVNVTETLDAAIKGSGNIYYRGHPRITTDIKGSGTLISSN
jgi:hypothetical protein